MLRVSTASVFITPTKDYLPCYLSGMAIRKGKTDKIHDELECTMLMLQKDDKTMIWGEFDLLLLDLALSNSIREALSEKYQIPRENIILGAIHTHSGPEISETNIFGETECVAVPGYREFVKNKCLETVAECYEKGFTEVTPYAQTVIIDGFYGNRNSRDRISDKCVTMLKFRDWEGKLVAGCVNLACHPTVNDPLSMEISGDLFGYISRGIQDRWGVSPLMMQGASGDVSTRKYRQASDFHEVARIGEGILHQIDTKASDEKAIDIQAIQVVPYHYFDAYDRDLKKIQEEVESIEKKLEHETNFERRKLLIGELVFLKQQLKAVHVVNEFDASIIRLGDFEICQIPAELFARLGLQIKAASRAKCAIIWGYTNDDYGYLVEAEEYDKCYEGRATTIRKGEPERLTQELAALMTGIEFCKKENGKFENREKTGSKCNRSQ